MAFLQTGIFSQVLGIQTAFNVIIPEVKGQAKPKVLYLLHGLSDDHTIWSRRTSIERYASAYNLAVIMPTTQRGFYTNMKIGYNYWTYISEELPEIVKSIFNISDKREDTFAAGLSMGGYGAIKLGLVCPDKFGAVASMSGALNMRNRNDLSSLYEYESTFGVEFDDNNDLLFLADKLAKSGKERPRLYTCCGTEDFLYNDNQIFLNKVKALNYDIIYKEGPGNHTWEYWDTMIQDILKWMHS
ncbi:MAG: esterase family protein [Clostridia bacterium]|nr:esterase family protein [Clostridia bacterium]